MQPSQKKYPQKIRNRITKKIQENYGFPEKPLPDYESLINYLDNELENQASAFAQGFQSKRLEKTMQVIDKLCKSIPIDETCLNNLRKNNYVKKDSYLDKMLEETL